MLKEIENAVTSNTPISSELTSRLAALADENESLQKQLEDLDPNSQKNVQRRWEEEGFPTVQNLKDSLPSDWKTANGDDFVAKITNWTGEGYTDTKKIKGSP